MSGTTTKKEKPISGCDSEGHKYKSTDEMWAAELGSSDNLYDPEKGWYGKALNYWANVPATVSGVLGGMEHVDPADIKESQAFITSLPNHGTGRALDCGAGIGRITKSLLVHMYDCTDVMEPVPHMLEKAKEELAGLPVGDFMLESMEKANLKKGYYDLIVIQWTAIYLTDADFVRFFHHCKEALTPNGFIFFKENVAGTDSFVVDKDDSSLTRSDKHYKRLFAEAGVTLAKEALQVDWPKDLFAVKMYALN